MNTETPAYGGRKQVELERISDMSKGDAANNTRMNMSVHTGTHLDMPLHFYADGQDINSFDADFWFFEKPLFVDVKPADYVIRDELFSKLDTVDDAGFDCIIVRTGFDRTDEDNADKNFGFHESVADYIREKYKNVRLFGMDTLSVSSFQNRPEGRKAHKAFLNPEKPIVLLEDMKLDIENTDIISRVIILPLRVDETDGLPCTVVGEME
nr:cyclase family protein [Seleniivibrio woodruffii]